MALNANIGVFKDLFVAELSDGRRIEHPDLPDLAQALCRAGVTTNDLNFDWRAGTGMITAGRQVALSAAMRLMEGRPHGLSAAA